MNYETYLLYTDVRLSTIAIRYWYNVMGIRSIVQELTKQDDQRRTQSSTVVSAFSAALKRLKKSPRADEQVTRGELAYVLDMLHNVWSAEHESRSLLLRSSCLVLLVSTFDLLVAQLIREYLTVHREALALSGQNISWRELLDMGSLDQFIHYAITRRVDQIMWGGIDQWSGFLRQHDIDPEWFVPDWDSLYEAFQRRHVIVHNGGIASHRYLSKVSQSWLRSQEAEISLHSDLTPSRNYLEDKVWLFLVSGIVICDAVWARLAEDDHVREVFLLGAINDLLRMSEWRTASLLCEELLAKSRLTMETQTMIRLNLCLCKKRMGQGDAIPEEVRDFDPSKHDMASILAYYALCEDRDQFFGYLLEAISAKQIGRKELEEWPIFDSMRSDSRFQEYLELFNDTEDSDLGWD